MRKIYCLMTGGISVSEDVSEALFETACIMIKKGENRRVIKDYSAEGEIRTSFEHRSFGSIAGIEFFATVETEMGTGNVKYLVRHAEAAERRKAPWTEFDSPEDLLDALNSPPSRMSPSYN